MRRATGRRGRWLTVALGALGLAALAGVGPEGRAGAAGTYNGLARADGVRIITTIPGFPITDVPVDAGGPVVQAQLDSLGNNVAYASFPYPGETVVVAPRLAAAFGVAGLPDYPLYVRADGTNPDASTPDGPYSLRARVTDGTLAEAGATVGALPGLVGSTVSDVVVDLDEDGTLTTEAIERVDGVNIGVVQIGSIVSRARTVRSPTGSIERSSSLEIFGGAIGGLAFGIRDGSLTLLGVGAPATIPQPDDSVLRTGGFDIRYLAPIETETGIISPGLEITSAQGIPLPIPTQAAVVSVRAGRVEASATSTSFGTPTTSRPAATATGTAAPPAISGPTGAVPTTPGLQPSPTSLPAATGGVSPALVTVPASSTPFELDGLKFYAVIVIGAVVAFAALHGIRLAGVRKPWSS